MARLNKTVTLTPGTPLQLSQIFGYNNTFTSNNFPGGAPMIINRVFVQMAIGGTGVGYVMDGIPKGTIPSHSTASQLTAQIGAASGANPGGSYSDRSYEKDGGGIDGSQFWVDGSAADPMIISVDVRV